MARKIDTADSVALDIRGGRKIVVQEFSSFGFMQAVGSIRKIITRVREAGDLEGMFRGLWDAAPEGTDRKVNINQLVELLEMVMGAMGDDPEPLFKIVLLSVRDEGDNKFTVEQAHDLAVEDMISILKAIYELNFTKLKKALTKAGLVTETTEKDDPSPSPSISSPTTPTQPSPTPVES